MLMLTTVAVAAALTAAGPNCINDAISWKRLGNRNIDTSAVKESIAQITLLILRYLYFTFNFCNQNDV
jgi:hypothetical protein